MKNIGVDLGGHKIAAAIVDFGGELPKICARLVRPTPESREVGEVIGALAEMITELSGDEKIVAVGVGLPGFINKKRRVIEKLTNFADFENVEFADKLEEVLDKRDVSARVFLENDANCFAVGEGVRGAARGMSDYVIFTLGTGIGAGIVAGGRLLTGAHGFAGEAGHVSVCDNLPCMCGGFAHAESFAGADAVEKAALVIGLPGDFEALWRVRYEDRVRDILEPALDALARCAASVSVITDPEIVVLNGGVSRAQDLVGELTPRVLKYLPAPFKPKLRIEISKLGNDAVFYGASSLGIKEI